jgi:hypothetical protein
MNARPLNFSGGRARRGKERRKSRDNSGNQSPKLFGLQQSEKLFHKLECLEEYGLQIVRSDQTVNTAKREKDIEVGASFPQGGEFPDHIHSIPIRFKE